MDKREGGGTHALPVVHAFLRAQGEGTNFSFFGHTALHWAAAQGQAACVRWLLGAGADVARGNRAGSTPLHVAVEHGQMEAAKMLISEGGADVEVRRRVCLLHLRSHWQGQQTPGHARRPEGAQALTKPSPSPRACAQARDDLGQTPCDLALRRAGGGADAARLLRLLAQLRALRAVPEPSWAPKAMREVLAAAGVSTAGVLERADLIMMAKALIERFDAFVPAPLAAAARSGGPPPPWEEGGGGWPGGGSEFGDEEEEDGPWGARGYELGEEDEEEEDEEETSSPEQVERRVEQAKLKGNQCFGAGDYHAVRAPLSWGASAVFCSCCACTRLAPVMRGGCVRACVLACPQAIKHYSMAIRLAPRPSAVLHSNRAAAYAAISHFVKSLEDAGGPGGKRVGHEQGERSRRGRAGWAQAER